jgi:squalene cyclase
MLLAFRGVVGTRVTKEMAASTRMSLLREWADPELTAGRAAAVSWLVGEQSENGMWADFRTFAGASDEWVTGFVGAVLAAHDDEPAQSAARRAWTSMLARRHDDGGWGYNRAVPSDADSTACALRLASGVGADSATIESIGLALQDFQGEHGGLHTYSLDGPIREFTAVAPEVSFAGWCAAHACVTAAAAAVGVWPGAIRARAYLAQSQQVDGCWRAYWWRDDLYATAFATVALAQVAVHAESLQQAARWVVARLGEDGRIRDPVTGGRSAFLDALALLILSASSPVSEVSSPMRRLASAVLADQQLDGHWAPSAGLRIPPPGVVDADTYEAYLPGLGGGSLIEDPTGSFTTATVLLALDSVGHCAPDDS